MKTLRTLLAMLAISPAAALAADARLILDILECESGYRTKVCSDGGKSCGIAQFQRETFYRFARLAKLQNWGLGKPEWNNQIHQVKLLEWAIDNGLGNHWTCYIRLEHTE